MNLSPELIPREIVEALDTYIIGQHRAKRMVAIALRNRWRRQHLPDDLRDEVLPKNIIMIGPTGVGKTEISRRLARLANAPFLKVEASKFTEVGYVGRDVESMVRDLCELAVGLVKSEHQEGVREKAQKNAEERLLDLLLPPIPSRQAPGVVAGESVRPLPDDTENSTREKLRRQLREGSLNGRIVEVEVRERAMPLGLISTGGTEELEANLREMLGGLFPGKSKARKMRVEEAKKVLEAEEAQRLIDMDEAIREAISRTEQSGIIFLDEIDKIAGREKSLGPDVSREGVQRDLLPIVEGSTVNTKYGPVRTDHILFIAAGAFHAAKPSDLIPELQGRFPIRVELEPLERQDFVRILTEPKNALIRQYTALLETEGITVRFERDAIEEIARFTAMVNEKSENIGARRLFTLLEKLLEDVSFSAPELQEKKVTIDSAYVRDRLADIVKDQDLSRYIL